MLDQLISVLGPKPNAVDLAAALCLLTGVDVTLLPLSYTTSGRVLTSMGVLAARGCGPIQIPEQTQGFTAVSVECIAPQVPAEMETALVEAGVAPEVVTRLYFDERHGQTFRQRMKHQWQTFVYLAINGQLDNPTGYFIKAIRSNWHLSKDYEKGKKAAPKVKPAVTPDPSALPVVGALVRVAGDLGRACRVVEHKWTGGEWRAVVEDLLDGAVSVVEARKIRLPSPQSA